MDNLTCCTRNSCAFFAVLFSIIIGIAVALLRFTAVITITPAILWVLLGISAAYLFTAPIAFVFVRRNRCSCSLLSVILTGIVGTLLTSLVLLTITFEATSVIGAIITGALAAFFILAVITTACITKCICSAE